jgi:hypothetical protein
VPEVDVSGRGDVCSPALQAAQNEAHLGQVAWNRVAPIDGQLSDQATPLQRMLYTRMVTSESIFRMAMFHERRRRLGQASSARDAKPGAPTLSRARPRIYAA